MEYKFEVDEQLVHRLQQDAEVLGFTTNEAVALALKEWCENREWLLGPGKKRFPAAAACIFKGFEDDDTETTSAKLSTRDDAGGAVRTAAKENAVAAGA